MRDSERLAKLLEDDLREPFSPSYHYYTYRDSMTAEWSLEFPSPPDHGIPSRSYRYLNLHIVARVGSLLFPEGGPPKARVGEIGDKNNLHARNALVTLPCDGGEYDPEEYPELDNLLMDRFGFLRLPDLRGLLFTEADHVDDLDLVEAKAAARCRELREYWRNGGNLTDWEPAKKAANETLDTLPGWLFGESHD